MQLMEKSLSGLTRPREDFASIDGHEFLTRRVAAVHVIYYTYQSHLFWFGQLASHMPGVMVTLDSEQRVPDNSEEMVCLQLELIN